MVWNGPGSGGTETYYALSTNGGGTFSAPSLVRSGAANGGYSANNATSPVVAADGSGNVYVAFSAFTKDTSSNFVGYNIWVSQSTNGGSSFQSEALINAVSSAQKVPVRIRATTSNVYVFFRDETNYDLYFVRRNSSGTAVSSRRVNPVSGAFLGSADLAVGANETRFFRVSCGQVLAMGVGRPPA